MSRLVLAVMAAAALSVPSTSLSEPQGGGAGRGSGGSHGGPAHFGGQVATGRPFGHGPAVFHGRDFHRLSPAEFGVWSHGHWWHGARGGRVGWWWWADGGWYWYDSPIYPYPTMISETVVVDAPPGVNGGYSWWYCDSSGAYWPYVRACATPWRAISPTPPPQ